MTNIDIALLINIGGIVFMAGIHFSTMRHIGERVAHHEKLLHNGEGLVAKVARLEENQENIEAKLDAAQGDISEIKKMVRQQA